MSSQRGFATVFFLSFIPVLIAAGWGLFFCFAFLKADLAVLNACRTEHLKIQDKVGRDLTKLLGLNPKALQLRSQYIEAQRALAAAVASENPIAIATATQKLFVIETRRQALAARQQILIQGANLKFTLNTPQITAALARKWAEQTRPLSSWLQAGFRMTDLKVPTLSVRPDLPDVAPVYEPVPQFEEAQSWAHSWQIELREKNWVQRFLTFGGRFQRSCSTSLYPEGRAWTARLKKAKSLSSLW